MVTDRSPALIHYNVPSGVPPNKATFIDDLVVMLPQNVWDHLYSRYAENRPIVGTTGGFNRFHISRYSLCSQPQSPFHCEIDCTQVHVDCSLQVWRRPSGQPPVRLPHLPDRDRETGETAQVGTGHVCQGRTFKARVARQ